MTHNQPIYVEKQAFALFGYLVLIAVAAMFFLIPAPPTLISIPVLVILCVTNLLWEETVVTGRGVRVRFGFLIPFYVRDIPLPEIDTVESVTYSPLMEYGGWGIRGFGDNVALNARGNRGVRLRLTGNRRLLIGSQRPDELADAIRRAKSGL